jgi:riboflavin synthase alpha subunit
MTVKHTPFTAMLSPIATVEKSKPLEEKVNTDGQGKIIDKTLEGESTRFKVNVAQSLVKYIARKGSITVNGVSLTVNSIEAHSFAFNLANGLDNTCKHLLTLFLM